MLERCLFGLLPVISVPSLGHKDSVRAGAEVPTPEPKAYSLEVLEVSPVQAVAEAPQLEHRPYSWGELEAIAHSDAFYAGNLALKQGERELAGGYFCSAFFLMRSDYRDGILMGTPIDKVVDRMLELAGICEKANFSQLTNDIYSHVSGLDASKPSPVVGETSNVEQPVAVQTSPVIVAATPVPEGHEVIVPAK